ncbi:MAG: M56 family metallopeptidase, partial [Actinomycetes bacterium]
MVAAAMLGWAVLLGLAAPAALRRAAWPARAPRLGLLLWQAASVSFIVALILGGLALAVPTTVVSGGLADLVTNCVMAIRDAYRTPAGAGAAGAGLVLAAGVTGRTGWCLCTGMYQAARRRRQHAQALTMVARRDPSLGALVVEHAAARAYCLPGRHATVVVTTGALTQLSASQLVAVLAHEHAHVRARHHLVVAAAAGLARAFPGVPLLRHAAVIVPALVEMAADDTAGRNTDRARVAAALAALAGAVT